MIVTRLHFTCCVKVKSLRRQQKPVSGHLGAQRNQTTTTILEVNGLETTTQVSHSVTVSSTSTTSSASSAWRPSGLPVKSLRKKSSIEQAARSAKKKWDLIDKKVCVVQRSEK